MTYALQIGVEAGRSRPLERPFLKPTALLLSAVAVIAAAGSALRAQELAPYLEAANHGPLLAYASVPPPPALAHMALIAPDLGCLRSEENLSHQSSSSSRQAPPAGTQAPSTSSPTGNDVGSSTSGGLSLSSPPSTELTTPETSVHLAYDNVQAIFKSGAGKSELVDDGFVIVRAKMSSRFAYQGSTKVETGFGQYLGPDTIARWRTNGAGVEDPDYLYVKFNVRF